MDALNSGEMALRVLGCDASANECNAWLKCYATGATLVTDEILDYIRELRESKDPGKQHYAKLDRMFQEALFMLKSKEGRVAFRAVFARLRKEELLHLFGCPEKTSVEREMSHSVGELTG